MIPTTEMIIAKNWKTSHKTRYKRLVIKTVEHNAHEQSYYVCGHEKEARKLRASEKASWD